MTTIIGSDPPNDGRHWECQCARCGSSMYFVDCGACGGEGTTAPGELYEQDPLWYDEDEVHPCHQCGGEASWPVCGSDEEYCQGNALLNRGHIPRHTPEWFAVGPKTQ